MLKAERNSRNDIKQQQQNQQQENHSSSPLLPDWFHIQSIREQNKSLDWIQGPRAHLVAPYSYSREMWDHLVNHLCDCNMFCPVKYEYKGEEIEVVVVEEEEEEEQKDGSHNHKRKKHKNGAKRKFKKKRTTTTPPPNPMSLQFYVTCPITNLFLSQVTYAGFFPFGSEFEYEGKNLCERGLLNLELGGENRLPDGSGDPGGRLVLCGETGLRVGSKSLKTVGELTEQQTALASRLGRDIAPICSSKCRKAPYAYVLTVNRCFYWVWEEIVNKHGEDWLGFDQIKQAYFNLYASSSTTASSFSSNSTRMLSFELWELSSVPCVVSAEVGYIVGKCYTCLSLFSDTVNYPRCDHVRTQASILWLSRAGVELFDVGTTANYYQALGFEKTTRTEFVQLWRRFRDQPLVRPDLLFAQGSCSICSSLHMQCMCSAVGISVKELLSHHVLSRTVAPRIGSQLTTIATTTTTALTSIAMTSNNKPHPKLKLSVYVWGLSVAMRASDLERSFERFGDAVTKTAILPAGKLKTDLAREHPGPVGVVCFSSKEAHNSALQVECCTWWGKREGESKQQTVGALYMFWEFSDCHLCPFTEQITTAKCGAGSLVLFMMSIQVLYIY